MQGLENNLRHLQALADNCTISSPVSRRRLPGSRCRAGQPSMQPHSNVDSGRPQLSCTSCWKCYMSVSTTMLGSVMIAEEGTEGHLQSEGIPLEFESCISQFLSSQVELSLIFQELRTQESPASLHLCSHVPTCSLNDTPDASPLVFLGCRPRALPTSQLLLGSFFHPLFRACDRTP